MLCSHRSVYFRSQIDFLEEEMPENGNGSSGWEPNIIAFCCRHCAYAAADLAVMMVNDEDISGSVSETVNNGTADIPSALIEPIQVDRLCRPHRR